jgi:Ca2+-binding RTX toxin-like protein
MATFFGDDLPNTYPGTAAADKIFGAGGNDTLNGAGDNDTIFGDSGNDSLNGGLGQNFLDGGEGNDTLNAFDLGIDSLFGGIGNDVYIVSTTEVEHNLVEGVNQGIDSVWSFVRYYLDVNVENLFLTGGAVIGVGNGLSNLIIGSTASNNLVGFSGNDTLEGKEGNDFLTGGLDSDRFDFATALPGAGVDTISDFLVGTDKIFLSKGVFSALETIPLAGNVLGVGDFASINVAAELEVVEAVDNPKEIVYNRQTGSLFYNANDAGAGFGTGGGKFATLRDSPDTLSNTAFTVTV